MGVRIISIPLFLCVFIWTVIGTVQSDLSSLSSPDSYMSSQLPSAQGQYSDNSGYASSQLQVGYGAPQPDYAPPRQEYGPPTQEYGPPKQEYGPPKQEYGPPKQEYGPPTQEYGPPKQEYGPPTPEYGPPKQEYGQPAQEYGSPPQYGQPVEQYGAPSAKPVYGVPTPASSSNLIEKYHFKAVLIAFKFMMLFLLYILYEITYVGIYPRRASTKPQSNTRHIPSPSITSIALRFVNKIVDGEFDISDLFKDSGIKN